MAVIPLGIDRADQITDRVADALPTEQFIRELLYNSIQAVARVGGGDAHIDYVDIDFVTKLRFWDTGDGMGPAEMVDRLGNLGAADRTGTNHGVGAKVSLRNISPHGAVFISLQDGHAHELILADEGDGFGLVRFTDDPDPVRAATRPVDVNDPRIPAGLRRTGHGTVVIVLGRSAEDATSHSLRPDADRQSDWWLAAAVNSRFARFPDGVSVHVAGYADKQTGKRNQRAASGCAANADHYVTRPDAGTSRDVDLHGAKGKVALHNTIPATAYWWVLPNQRVADGTRTKKDLISHYRVGNQVRVCSDDEVYLESSRALRTAGVWTNQHRIQIHIVPDETVTVTPDIGRTQLVIDGVKDHQALEAWCEELAGRLPAAIVELMKSGRTTRKGDAAGTKMTQFYNELYHVFVRSNRGRSHGNLLDEETLAGTSGASAEPGSRPTRTGTLSRLRDRVAGVRRARSATTGATTGTGTVVALGEGTVPARRAALPPIEAPEVRWVNTGPDDRSTDFTDVQAGCYEAASNTLILNAEFIPVATLVRMYADKARAANVAGAHEYVEGVVHDRYEDYVRGAVTGSMMLWRGDRHRLEAVLTDEALTAIGANVNEVAKRVNVVLGGKLHAGLAGVSLAAV